MEPYRGKSEAVGDMSEERMGGGLTNQEVRLVFSQLQGLQHLDNSPTCWRAVQMLQILQLKTDLISSLEKIVVTQALETNSITPPLCGEWFSLKGQALVGTQTT